MKKIYVASLFVLSVGIHLTAMQELDKKNINSYTENFGLLMQVKFAPTTLKLTKENTKYLETIKKELAAFKKCQSPARKGILTKLDEAIRLKYQADSGLKMAIPYSNSEEDLKKVPLIARFNKDYRINSEKISKYQSLYISARSN